jgi:hypothetical protein
MFGFPYHTSKSEVKMSDDWVYVWSLEAFTLYYKPSFVEIDKQKKTVNVLVKHDLTENGKIALLRPFCSIEKEKYNDINHTLVVTLFYYKYKKYSTNKTTYYSKSGIVLLDYDDPLKWNEIISGSSFDILIHTILRDYNI